MIVGIEVEAGDIADDRQLIDVDLPGADKEIGREGVDAVANRRIRESEVAEAELLPFDTGAVDAMSRYRRAVEPQRNAPVIDRLPVYRRPNTEERRVWKECVSTCRTQWSQNHKQKKQ